MSTRGRSSLLLLSLACAIGLGTAGTDPWQGKSRSDVVALLGEPNKAKTTADGELLTYKLVRLDEDALPPAGMRVLSVPGVKGTLGTRSQPGALSGDDVNIRPSDIDKSGRGTGGGMETDESYNVSWSSKDGVERSWEEGSAIRGKVTLKFVVNAKRRVESWSVSPKKLRD